jgi:hypothetical protein
MTPNIYWKTGVVPTFGDIFSSAQLVISGDFAVNSAVDTGFSVNTSAGTATMPIVSLSEYESGLILYNLAGLGVDDIGAQATTFTAYFDLVPHTSGVESTADDGHETEFTLCTLEKNGTVKTVWNIPSPTSSESVVIRITNTSGTDGTVNGRLYYTDTLGNFQTWSGPIVGTNGVQTENLASHETLQILNTSWADIDESLSFPESWSGRARLVLESTLPSMEVANWLVYNGVLVNMSSVVKDGDE